MKRAFESVGGKPTIEVRSFDQMPRKPAESMLAPGWTNIGIL